MTSKVEIVHLLNRKRCEKRVHYIIINIIIKKPEF